MKNESLIKSFISRKMSLNSSPSRLLIRSSSSTKKTRSEPSSPKSSKTLSEMLEEETTQFPSSPRLPVVETTTPAIEDDLWIKNIELLCGRENLMGRFIGLNFNGENRYYLIIKLEPNCIYLHSLDQPKEQIQFKHSPKVKSKLSLSGMKTINERLLISGRNFLFNDEVVLPIFDFNYRPIDINTSPNWLIYKNICDSTLLYSAKLPDKLKTLKEEEIYKLCNLNFELVFRCEDFDARISRIYIAGKNILCEVILTGIEENNYQNYYMHVHRAQQQTRSQILYEELVYLHKISQIPKLQSQFSEQFTMNIDEMIKFDFKLIEIRPG